MLALAVVCALFAWFLGLPAGERAKNLLLYDPDNYQRLVEVRDWLGGQSWWDTRQYRVDPPQGLQMHWSRLADIPLALAVTLLSLFTGREVAETWAVVGLPIVLLLGTVLFLGRAAFHIGGVAAERAVPLLLIVTFPVLVQFFPGRIDHHGLQLFLLAAALAAATASPTWRNGFLTSLPVALSLLIGLETAPMLLMVPLWMASRWVVEGAGRMPQLQGFVFGLPPALVMLYALSVDPSSWDRQTHDQVGIGHIVIVAAGCSALWLSLRAGTLPTARHRLAILCLAGIASAAALLCFPGVLSAPYSSIDPLLQRLWIKNILETESAADIARVAPRRLLDAHLYPVLALITGAWVYLSTGRPPRLLLALMVGLTGFALATWQVRATSGAALIALLLCSVVIGHLWSRRDTLIGAASLVLGILALNGFLGPALSARLAPDKAEDLSRNRMTEICENRLRADAFDDVPPGLVLNAIDSGAAILTHTHHSVMAVGNHRAVKGNGTAYRLFLAPTSAVREELAASEIAYVLTCNDNELRRLARHAPDGLAADLVNGRIPTWLVPQPHDEEGAVLFYAVDRRSASTKNPEAADRPCEKRDDCRYPKDHEGSRPAEQGDASIGEHVG